MKTRILLCAAILAAFSFAACNQQDSMTEPENEPQRAKSPSGPAISSISPTSAEIGDVLTINGSKFGGNFSQRSVTINGKSASVIKTWTVTKIEVLVPSGAAFGPGQVTVTIGNNTTNAVAFTLLPSSDVQIGTQIWMGANLSVTKYRSGVGIPEVTDPAAWVARTDGAWCYYNNDPSTEPLYGRLYNWYAVNHPDGLAPAGWHVPTQTEWKTLFMYLGMTQAEADGYGYPPNAYYGTDEGGKLKEAGLSTWASPNVGATNLSGFTALPGGYRGTAGSFYGIGGAAGWWASTEYNQDRAWMRMVVSPYANTYHNHLSKTMGWSVRCVKDN